MRTTRPVPRGFLNLIITTMCGEERKLRSFITVFFDKYLISPYESASKFLSTHLYKSRRYKR